MGSQLLYVCGVFGKQMAEGQRQGDADTRLAC